MRRPFYQKYNCEYDSDNQKYGNHTRPYGFLVPNLQAKRNLNETDSNEAGKHSGQYTL